MKTKTYRRGELYQLVDLMKLLAKSKIGRMEWSIQQSVKHTSRLLPSNMQEWSPAQKYYVYWSTFYDGIYQHFERPPDSVIDDDDLLEMWLKKQEEKVSVQANKNWKEGVANQPIKTAWSHPEVIMMEDEEY